MFDVKHFLNIKREKWSFPNDLAMSLTHTTEEHGKTMSGISLFLCVFS